VLSCGDSRRVGIRYSSIRQTSVQSAGEVVDGRRALAGEPQRDRGLPNVVTWRETPFFTEGERAALALTDAATRIQDGAQGVTDGVRDAAAGPGFVRMSRRSLGRFSRLLVFFVNRRRT
jgi:hypothetical protein